MSAEECPQSGSFIERRCAKDGVKKSARDPREEVTGVSANVTAKCMTLAW